MNIKEFTEGQAVISDLVYRYAHCIRAGDVDTAATLFTDDAIFEIREVDLPDWSSRRVRARLVGKPAIRDYIAKSTSAGVVAPMISNLVVDVQGNRATAMSMMRGLSWPGRKETVGEYADSFRRDAAWRFDVRIFTIFN